MDFPVILGNKKDRSDQAVFEETVNILNIIHKFFPEHLKTDMDASHRNPDGYSVQ